MTEPTDPSAPPPEEPSGQADEPRGEPRVPDPEPAAADSSAAESPDAGAPGAESPDASAGSPPADQPPGDQAPPPPPGPPPPGFPPPPPSPPPPPPGGPPPGPGQPPPGSAPPPPPGWGYGQVQPGAVPPGLYRDPSSGVLIPNGVELASHGRRIGAYFLAIPLVIVTLVIGYVVWGVIAWTKGTTPALQVLGMRVWVPNKRRVAPFGTMVLREVVGQFLISIIPFTQLASFILFLARSDRKALHDLVADTVVVRDPNRLLG